MFNILHCLQLGETMRDRFLEQARALPYGSALFVVPNRYFLQKVRETGAVRAVIMDSLPGEILRWNRAEGEFRRITRPAQKKILEDTLEKLKDQLSYFSSLVGKDGFRDSLLGLFDEFSRNGLDPDTYQRILMNWNREGALRNKDMDLAKLYLVYSTLVSGQKLEDLSQSYARAAKVLEEGGSVPWQQCFFSEFYQLDPVQLRLLKALGRCCPVEMGLFYDPKRPELSQVTEKIYGDLLGDGFQPVPEEPVKDKPEDLAALAREWKPGAKCGLAADHIHLGEGASQEQEIRLALTSIKERLQDGVQPEEILVLVRKLQDYQGLVRSFAQYGIPCRLPLPADLKSQPLPDFLTKLLAAAGEKWDLSLWQALFRCPLMELLFQTDRENLDFLYTQAYFSSAGAFLAHVRRKELVSAGFWDLVDFLQQDHTPEAWRDGLTEWLDRWQLARTWGQLHKEGKVDLDQVKLLAGTEDFVRKTLDSLVKTWEQCGEEKSALDLDKIRTFWKDSLAQASLPLTPGEPRGIPVREAGEIQGAAFPYVYILGVREGMFPAVKRESWLYSDQERAELNALGLELSLTARALDTDRYFFGSAAALASRELHLSWYSDEEGGASPYITGLEHFYAPDSLPVTVYEADPDRCASPALLTNCLAEQEWLGPREKETLLAAVGTDFSDRTQSARRRWEEPDSPWNGTVPGVVKKPLHLSASSLDAFLQCPFAALVSRVWKLVPWEEQEPWPAPDVVGNLLHQTLAAFLGNHLQTGLEAKNREILEQELEQVYQGIFDRFHQEGKIPDSPLLDHIRERYGKELRTWLRGELDYEARDQLGLKPWKVEWSFGREHSPWPALTRTVDGEKVWFSGQIDRIDSNGKTWSLLDYKTGQPPTGQDILQGRAVQLPLYLEALAVLGEVDPEAILGGGYVQLCSGERKGGIWDKAVKDAFPWMQKARPPEKKQALEAAQQAMDQAVREIREGKFPARPSGTCPGWCPARDLCRIGENPHRTETVKEEE
ncbi:PD-(D/E)XK nuclease family protein [Acidaminococcus fermentans]